MFSKTSLFSGLNNLEDISLNPQFATICGYTDADLDTVFAPELPGLDRERIRAWCNGYHWRGDATLYNPFDALLLFRSREFAAHWYETGTPEFLHRLIAERKLNLLQLESRPIPARQLARFDVDDIDLHALMFQAGYLTIAGEQRRGRIPSIPWDTRTWKCAKASTKTCWCALAGSRPRCRAKDARCCNCWRPMISKDSGSSCARAWPEFRTSGGRGAGSDNTRRITRRCCT